MHLRALRESGLVSVRKDTHRRWYALEPDDIDAEHARLTGLGVAFTGPPTDMGPVRAATLDDTCGNLLMLYSEAPATAAQTASA